MANGFQEAKVEQAYLKMGVLGFAAAGKSFTTVYAAIGHVLATKDKRPVYFLDTETGSDWFVETFKQHGIPFEVWRTRSFKDLRQSVYDAEKNASFLIIDSVTHFWRELVEARRESKRKAKNLPTGTHMNLTMHDWGILKPLWWKFTEAMVNSKVSIAICGRAGYEYDNVKIDEKEELRKVDIKMQGEKETGFEPSLLILMERATDPVTKKTTRSMTVLKDRSREIDGKVFTFSTQDAFKMDKVNKVYKAIAPHVGYLNVGGDHKGFDPTRNSEELFLGADGDIASARARKACEVELDVITAELQKRLNTRQENDKKFLLWFLEAVFGTPSWKVIEKMKVDELKTGLEIIKEFFTLWDGGSDADRTQMRLDASAYVTDARNVVAMRHEAPSEAEKDDKAGTSGEVDNNDLPY